MKNLYVNESCVVVNNKFEQKCFIFDRQTKITYNINKQMFNLLKDIKHNINTQCFYSNKYTSEIINNLLSLNIITYEAPRVDNNIKEIKEFNCARLFFELTSKCNLKCIHCYGSFSSLEQKELNYLDIISILEKSKEYGTYQIDFTGGEPLMYRYLDKLLEYCYLNGFLVRIFTNLTLFNDNFLNMFKKYGVKEIVTSIDSCHAECHNQFRGVPKSFEKTIEAIKTLKDNNIPVTINSMVGQHNKEHIEEMIRFIDSLNVKSVLDVIIPEGRANELDNSIQDSAKIIKDIYENHYNLIDKNAISVSCGIGDRFVYIKSNGNVYPCPSMINDNNILGIVQAFDIKKIWGILTSKYNFCCNKKTDKCKNCSGGCRIRANILHNNLNAEDDVYCIINGVADGKD